MRGDFRNGSHIDNSILVFESGDELIEGIGVGNAVDFDVGRELGFGRGTGEDFDVACEAGVGVEGREDGGTKIAGGLKGGVRFISWRGERAHFTPMTMMFLRMTAIVGTRDDHSHCSRRQGEFETYNAPKSRSKEYRDMRWLEECE